MHTFRFSYALFILMQSHKSLDCDLLLNFDHKLRPKIYFSLVQNANLCILCCKNGHTLRTPHYFRGISNQQHLHFTSHKTQSNLLHKSIKFWYLITCKNVNELKIEVLLNTFLDDTPWNTQNYNYNRLFSNLKLETQQQI